MNKKTGSRWALLLPFIPLICGLMLLIMDGRAQQALRNNLFDQYQRWHPRDYVAAPVRIIDIDDESLARLGQWPWPRTRMAELVDRLTAAQVAAIGFDVMFAEPDRTSPKAAADLWQLDGRLRQEVASLPDHDALFAESLKKADVVLGFAVERGEPASASSPPPRLPIRLPGFASLGEPQDSWLHPFTQAVTTQPQLDTAAKGNGALTFVPDSDGVVRRVPLVLQVAGKPVPTLISESLRVAQGASTIILRSAGHLQGFLKEQDHSGLGEIKIGDATIPTTAQGEVWVYYSRAVPERTVPAWKVFTGEVPAEMLEGNIVLIGTSAQGLMDLRFNPFGLMPGVEAHAQALEQILGEHLLERPSWARGLEILILLVAGLGVGILALRARALIAAGVCLAALAIVFGGAWYAFIEHGLLLDSATPSIGIVLTFVLSSLAHHFTSEREQRWIKQAFARYVSPNRVAHLVDNPDAMELGGRRQDCSFIFTDLAGFTTLMESMDPGEAVALLNAYLDEMIGIAFKHEGTLDRIVGDAVAIMFSAPAPQADHRARALACALEMDRFANQYSRDLQAKGTPFGKTRIGVHCGEVIVGNFGGSTIFDYRALGDPVNTAARLESVNKHLGTRLCVSAAILADCPDAAVRPVGRLVLKGKSQALAVFEPLTEDLAPQRAPLADYTAAFTAMHEERDEAGALFAQLASAWPNDPLVALHHRRLSAGERGDLIVMSEK